MNFEFKFPDVRQCIGSINADARVPIAELLRSFDIPAGTHALVVHWPRDYEGFTLSVGREAGAAPVARDPVPNVAAGQVRRRRPITVPHAPLASAAEAEATFDELSITMEQWRNLMIEYGFDPKSMDPETSEVFFAAQHVVSGEISPQDTLVFTLRFDTDRAELLDEMDELVQEVATTGRGASRLLNAGMLELSVIPDENGALGQVKVAIKLAVYVKSPIVGRDPDLRHDFLCFTFDNFSPLTHFPGFAALDLGNTSTSFAYMDELDRKTFHVLDLTTLKQTAHKPLQESSNSVHSALFLSSYTPPDEPLDPDEPLAVAEAEWIVGDDALNQAGEEGFLLGPKRLSTAPRPPKSRRLRLNGADVEIPQHLPAELMISWVFKCVYQYLREYPRQLAITYPSTFSSLELNRLLTGIAHGINRSLCAPYQNFDRYWLEQNIPLRLDEATAAIFYFLYRDFFYSTGRLAAFHYLYNRGANLLLIDCGGGTTDVALVHVQSTPLNHPKPDNSAPADAPPNAAPQLPDRRKNWQIKLDVLGRTGLRRFGGDEITIAVYKVLKALIACRTSKTVRLELPTGSEKFAEWYARHENEIDNVFPTKFARIDRQREPNNHSRACKATKNFWMLAEKIKELLSEYIDEADDDERKVNRKERFTEWFKKQSSYLNDTKGNLAIREPPARPAAPAVLGGAAAPPASDFVAYWEKDFPNDILNCLPMIDAQIRLPLLECLEKANRLIRDRLQEHTRAGGEPAANAELALPDLPEDSELHRVYVVGNAARYPLVRQLIAQHLVLRIINHQGKPAAEPCWNDPTPDIKRIVFDKDNLKNAVVKGAVVAQRVEEQGFDARFVWDRTLSRRLPFTISFDSLDRGPITIYREHEHYDAMMQAPRPLPAPVGDAQREPTIMLDRKWPGDPDNLAPKPFLKFHFKDTLEGPLQVRYEETEGLIRFKIEDVGSGQVAYGQEIADPHDIPAMQRGDL